MLPELARLGFVQDRVRVKAVRGVQPVRHVYAAVRAAPAGEAVVRGAIEALQDAAAEVGAARPARPLPVRPPG